MATRTSAFMPSVLGDEKRCGTDVWRALDYWEIGSEMLRLEVLALTGTLCTEVPPKGTFCTEVCSSGALTDTDLMDWFD